MTRSPILLCLFRSFTPTCMRLIVQYLFSSLAFEVCAFLSHRSLLRMCFWVLRVEFLDYPSYERLRTVSKDELKFAFCERPSEWGERQFTYCSAIAKGLRFLNMVMTFVLYPLSHYNSITEPRARFLLSFIEHFTIDFPSHFILSIIDVHLDSASRDKLIFPSAITRLLHHFFVPFLMSNHFTHIYAIDAATVKYREAQFRL